MEDSDELAPTLEVDVETSGNGARVLTLRGELDVSTVPRFKQALRDALDDQPEPRVLVDLAEVTFIDSTALMTLLGVLRELNRREGHLALACSNPTVLRLFEVTPTTETFRIFPTRDGALGHLEAA
jgi:anti-sigma B factor antagonist